MSSNLNRFFDEPFLEDLKSDLHLMREMIPDLIAMNDPSEKEGLIQLGKEFEEIYKIVCPN